MIREDEADDDRVVWKIVTDPVEIIFLCFRPNGEILSYTLYKQNDRVSQYLFSPLFMIIKLSSRQMVTTMTIPGSERQFTFKGLMHR